MASVVGQHQFTTSPNIKISVARSTKREGKDVYARWRTEITALPSGSYPYSITGTIVMNEYRLADAVVLKNASPSSWSNAVIDYYPSSTGWDYVGEVKDPSVTTLPVRVRFVSSSGTVLHLEGEEEIPPFVLATPPTSVSTSVSSVGNTSTNFTVYWSGETQGTGEITGYYLQYRVGTSGSWNLLSYGSNASSTTVNLSSISGLSRGDTVYLRVQIVDEFACTSEYSSATASVYYSELPTAPTYINISDDIVANQTDNFTLSWGGASADAGSITGYGIYYLKNGSWVRYTTATSSSTTINLNNITVSRGDTVSFCVTTLTSLSLESDYSSAVATIKLAQLPTAPTWVTVTPTEIKRKESIDITWGGATAGTGSISYYILQYRKYNGSTWSGWSSAEYRSSEYSSCEPISIFSDLQGGNMIDVRIYTVNSYGLQSASYQSPSSYITIKGGGIRINVDGTWHEGTPYVNIDGTWYQGETFVNVNGNWHEGI